ncbi:hypothetical protein ELE36_02530 [Pseudolysobacter antarcticus]|uniref:Uncharacterized protein n=1 Tax=Pseudolysobacter antarcticus TaxID=2511995 RepID=A0A411HFU5_9GAMM|nr:hypothetical protein [Pseudolysobacter antarcticus]QBB69339.1 hypothetical protein ELE36_02530 [Pseudolysobacter antarcticus]
MNARLALATLALTAASSLAYGYDIITHGLLGEVAYQRSVLNPANTNAILPIVGFDRLDPTNPFISHDLAQALALTAAFPDGYFDDAATTNAAGTTAPFVVAHIRYRQQQEADVFTALMKRGYIPNASTQLDIESRVDGWLVRGVVREDDNDAKPLFGDWATSDQRDDDPYGPILRALRHFYDPVNDRAYDFVDNCATYGCVRTILWALGRTDPLHPASDTEDLSRRNHFSWQDARNNYWWGLTTERNRGGTTFRTAMDRNLDAGERLWRWASTIGSVGHVIHLVQDGAQPQHTRNDAHAPPNAWFTSDAEANEGRSDAAYEDYTDYRVTLDYATAAASPLAGNPLAHMDEGIPYPSELTPVVLGSYPNVRFSTPVKYFTTRHVDTSAATCGTGSTSSDPVCARRGMSDFSNRGFFTSGTVPGMRECLSPGPGSDPCSTVNPNPSYALPEETMADAAWAVQPIGLSFYVNGKQANSFEYYRSIIDTVAPGYVDALPNAFNGKVPIVTASMFRTLTDLLQPGGFIGSEYTISYRNMRYDADVLLPRAIGYSAGMIDYFFRGRLKVDAPQDGLFAFTDQGMAHTVDSDGYPRCTNNVFAPITGEPILCNAGGIFGFTKVRVKLRNDTPAITESGPTAPAIAQTLAATVASPAAGDPRLVAIARYHRNACYVPSLQGEKVIDYAGSVTTPTCAAGSRTTFQEVSVSAPLAMSASDLNGSASVPVTFDFGQDPIPVNATDVLIQVAYRGPLGDEPDGIAVGSIDVREPSYLTVWNNSDHAGCNGAWTTGNAAGCDYMSGGTALRPINATRLCIGTQLLYTRLNTGGNPDITLGNYVRVAALLDDQPHATLGRLIVGGNVNNAVVYPVGSITGQKRQAPMEQVSVASPYAPDPMFTKRGIVGSFRPLAFYLEIGADPQPSNDTGPNDVGALTPLFSSSVYPLTGGALSFPNAPVTSGACTPPPALAEPYFEDEIQATEAAIARGSIR